MPRKSIFNVFLCSSLSSRLRWFKNARLYVLGMSDFPGEKAPGESDLKERRVAGYRLHPGNTWQIPSSSKIHVTLIGNMHTRFHASPMCVTGRVFCDTFFFSNVIGRVISTADMSRSVAFCFFPDFRFSGAKCTFTPPTRRRTRRSPSSAVFQLISSCSKF